MISQVPANLDAEQAALGAALIDQQALLHLFEHVNADDFYHPAYRGIYATMKELQRCAKPIDLVHLKASLPVNCLADLLNLFESTPTSVGIASYCNTIADLANRRRAIEMLKASLDELHNPESDDPISNAQSKLLTLSKKRLTEAQDLGALVEDAYGRAWEAHQKYKNGEVVRAAHVESGIPPLDDLLTIKQGDMVIVGARPSAGKTSIGLQIALHIASEKPILFFSLEEPASQIADRYLTTMTGLGMRRIQEGRTTHEELDRLADAQASAQYTRLVVQDTPGLRVSDMRSMAMRLQAKRNEEWGAIMVDHMIKVRPENATSNGHQKLTQVSQDLKNMARVMRVPIIVLTQLKRPTPQDEEKEPRMSDLRESGSIEEDADSILLIHRPERDRSYSVAKFLLAKQRTGPCGSFELMFDAEKMRFKPMKTFGVL